MSQKQKQWETSSGTIESHHPPFRNVTLTVHSEKIEAHPIKRPDVDILKNTRNTILAVNYINTQLNSIGSQLNRIEN